ncbi:MAG: hypothetical protein QOC57_2103 [Ilumatobacteraceae bacterium]
MPPDERAKSCVVAGAGAGNEINVWWFDRFGSHVRWVACPDTSGAGQVPHATIGRLCVGD